MRFNRMALCLVGLVIASTPLLVFALPLDTDDLSSIQIDGTIGLAQAGENSCIAVWIPVGDNMAISGMKWYNNDSAVAFPGVLVQSGSAERPVSLTDAFEVATGVVGEASGWSEVEFSEPIVCSSAGMYVIFRVPSGGNAEYEGLGGGPAVGYTEAKAGYAGWMSADGEDWVQVHPAYGFAVRPVFVASEAGMFTKSSTLPGDELGSSASNEGVIVQTLMEPAAPNPFNPQTTMKFSLKENGRVDLAVYNLKGELVKRLLSEVMSAGEHSVVWNGRDHSGASLASGVYFAKFAAGNVVMTQRLVLVQ